MRTLLSALLLLSAASVSAGDHVRHEFSSTAPAGQVRRVVLDIPAGEVRIRNGAAGQIAISGHVSREPDGPRSREREQRIVDDSSVEIVVRGQEAVVRRQFGPNAQSWRAGKFNSYRIDVELPPGMSVDVLTRYGDLLVEGSFGDLDIDMTAGEVAVRVPKSSVRELRASCRAGEVRTNLGDEVITREGLFPGKTRFVNPAGKSLVNVHVTFGEVRVDLTP